MRRPEQELGGPVESERVIDDETRQELSQLWHKVFLLHDRSAGEVPETTDELLKVMDRELMTDADALVDEWGIDRHADLVTKLHEASGDRSQLQQEYLRAVAEEIYKLKERWQSGDTHWDSWPQQMRDDCRANCVGTTILTSSLLRQANIPYAIVTPVGHTAPVVTLDNGQRWLFDPHNGPTQVRAIQPTEREIGGHLVLEIQDPAIDYHLLPVHQPKNLVVSIVGNMNALQHEGTDAYKAGVPHKEEAKRYLEQHANQLGNFSFYGLDDALEPGRRSVREAPEMVAERERISILHNDAYDGAARQYLRTLGPAGAQEVIHEAKGKLEMLQQYLQGQGDSTSFSPELQWYAEAYRSGLDQLRQAHPAMVDEHLRSTLAWIEAMPERHDQASLDR